MAKNEALLKEIRENFTYAVDYWRDIREEGRIDMRYLSGDPWDPREKKAREDANRPCISLDELNQYVNQLINDVRLNKRAVRVVPAGEGANDQTAELRANLIRGIEYKSKAQAAYCTAFEGAAQRSYGFARISKRYVSPKSFDQELLIRRIPNPDTVLIDPDCKEADCSDMGWGFIVDSTKKSKFAKQWPKAEIKTFSNEMLSEYPAWVQEETVQVAEYWRRETTRRTLLVLEDGRQVYEDELPEGSEPKVLRSRPVEDTKVKQYITNGVEILEENDWDGQWIPIGVCLGKELYVDRGAGAKRVLMSLVRLARDPYMLYCYYRTCEMEVAGMSPKVPWVGYEGQFDNHEEEWASAHRAPIAYLQAKPLTDATGGTVLPLPQRAQWEPPIQALEMGAEAARRAIQAAVGMYNTSVGKQDSSARSGVAIKALDQQSAQGSFHFIDNYDTFLEHMGRMLNDLLDKTYDMPRDVGVRMPNDEHKVVHINEPHVDPQTKQPAHYRMDEGEHEVTITTGPSSDSQREEAADFMNALAGNEAIFPRIADLVVKLRNLGPIGDEIARRLTPPDIAAQQSGGQEIPPQAQQMIQQYGQMIDALTQQLNALSEEMKTKKVELDSKERIELMKIESSERIAQLQESTKREVAIAQLNAQEGIRLLEADLASVKHRLDLMHASHMADSARVHEADMADRQQSAQAQLQAQQQASQAGLQAQQQAHQAGLQNAQLESQASAPGEGEGVDRAA